jgi:hypothetical protein
VECPPCLIREDVLYIRAVQKLQFLSNLRFANNRLKTAKCGTLKPTGFLAGLGREPTGFLNKSNDLGRVEWMDIFKLPYVERFKPSAVDAAFTRKPYSITREIAKGMDKGMYNPVIAEAGHLKARRNRRPRVNAPSSFAFSSQPSGITDSNRSKPVFFPFIP